MYQVGARTVEIHFVEDEDDESNFGRIATLTVTGAPGDEFTANCFQYDGNTIFGFTEVLVGAEVRDRTGRVVAIHPTGLFTRRNTLFQTC